VKVSKVRLRYWFVLVVFFVGLFLFVLGLYFTYIGGELQLGFDLSIVGAVLLCVVLAVGVLYVARVQIKILGDARRF
jgi:hypothetical protein